MYVDTVDDLRAYEKFDGSMCVTSAQYTKADQVYPGNYSTIEGAPINDFGAKTFFFVLFFIVFGCFVLRPRMPERMGLSIPYQGQNFEVELTANRDLFAPHWIYTFKQNFFRVWS